MVEGTFTVSGIHCDGCETNIETGLRRLNGVRGVKADHQKQTIQVRFDEALLDVRRLAEHLERIGYSPMGNGK